MLSLAAKELGGGLMYHGELAGGLFGQDLEQALVEIAGGVVGSARQEEDHTVAAIADLLTEIRAGVDVVAMEARVVIVVKDGTLIAAEHRSYLVGAEHFLPREKEVEVLLPRAKIDLGEG